MYESTCHNTDLQGVVYILIFVAGLVLNGAALWAFVARRHSWTDTHIYMLNLVVADLALIVFLPFRIFDAFQKLSVSHLCTFLISIHYFNMYASIMTSTAISVHRCLLVRFPIRAKAWRWKRRTAVAVCLSIWALVFAMSFWYNMENSLNNLATCYESCDEKPLPEDFLALQVTLGYLVPLVIIVCCSSQTIAILRREKDYSTEKKSIVGIVTANMIVFIFCYTPMHVSLLLKYSTVVEPAAVNLTVVEPAAVNLTVVEPAATCSTTGGDGAMHCVLLVSEWIATTNCCLDFISYYFLLKSLYSSASRRRDKVAIPSADSFM